VNGPAPPVVSLGVCSSRGFVHPRRRYHHDASLYRGRFFAPDTGRPTTNDNIGYDISASLIMLRQSHQLKLLGKMFNNFCSSRIRSQNTKYTLGCALLFFVCTRYNIPVQALQLKLVCNGCIGATRPNSPIHFLSANDRPDAILSHSLIPNNSIKIRSELFEGGYCCGLSNFNPAFARRMACSTTTCRGHVVRTLSSTSPIAGQLSKWTDSHVPPTMVDMFGDKRLTASNH
jgi:hypothetical protein